MAIVEYPVAAVLKLWHMLLANVLGVDANTAWVGSIVLLVLTIRLLLLPLAYRQFRSSRILANLRPHLEEISRSFEGKNDQESRRELRHARRELQQENDYRVRDGCVPMLIQIPVIIGLYRLLLRIARPVEGLNAAHSGYGPLNAEDVKTFLDARLFDVPLPSYVSMMDSQLRDLGTSQPEVLHVALPLIAMASLFTTANYLYSYIRNRHTLDYSKASARFIAKVLLWMGPIVLLFPWIFGLTGPAPVALLLYWVCNNLWTAAQSWGIQARLNRTMPFTEQFREHYLEKKSVHVESKHAKKHGKHSHKALDARQQRPS